MIKNLIFDLGGVVFDEKNGATMKPLHEATCSAMYSMLWSNLLLGRISMEECFGLLKESDRKNVERLRGADTYEFYLKNLPPIEQTVDFIKQSGDEYNIYVLSNATNAMRDYAKRYFVESHCPINNWIFSCDEHLMKPDLKIFHLAIRKFGVEPSETMYFDDKLKNCVAAKMCGMDAAVVKNPNDIINALINK